LQIEITNEVVVYIQWGVKGIAGSNGEDQGVLTKDEAFDLIRSGTGIRSNWWRERGTITPPEILSVLTTTNLDRHLHDYAVYGRHSPYISVACGCVERDTLLSQNITYFAQDTALAFATEHWERPGALFYCWVVASLNPAVEIQSVAESVRDLNIYRNWSPFQLEGEVTAKIHIPANQVWRVEWWNGQESTVAPVDTFDNPEFIDPAPITNVRGLF
jgi:hypothetical protein